MGCNHAVPGPPDGVGVSPMDSTSQFIIVAAICGGALYLFSLWIGRFLAQEDRRIGGRIPQGAGAEPPGPEIGWAA